MNLRTVCVLGLVGLSSCTAFVSLGDGPSSGSGDAGALDAGNDPGPCNAAAVDCSNPNCDGQVCRADAVGFSCVKGGCVNPNDFPALPELPGATLTMRGDTAIITFNALDGARDYRIYPYPDKADLTAGGDGSLTVKNAIYRCAGDSQLQAREADVTSGFNVSLGYDVVMPAPTLDVSIAGYRPPELESHLGFVYLEPAAGRLPVYRLADPNIRAGFLNADWVAQPSNDYNAADYRVGAAARDLGVAAGLRDDGIVFYIDEQGTKPVYRQALSGGHVLFFTDGAEHDFRVRDAANTDPSIFKVAFKTLATQAPGSVELRRIAYGNTFHVLAAGNAHFQRVLHQGNQPLTTLTWQGLTAQTTLVVEALDQGCPFPNGHVQDKHVAPDVPEIATIPNYPSITLDEARLPGTGEVFLNGQHDPANRPKPIARSFLDARPLPPPQMDFHASFNDTEAWDPPPALSFPEVNAALIYKNDKWMISMGSTPNFTIEKTRGALHVACTDFGSACSATIQPLGHQWTLSADKFLHVRMAVELPSTLRRYPGIVITTTPFLEPGTPGYQSYEYPVSARLGPTGSAGPNSSILVHPLGGDFQVQFCDLRGWGVGSQCPHANSHGRLTHWTNNGQPYQPQPLTGQHSGFDEPVQIDVYASTNRIYTFMNGQPEGCANLPAGRMPAGDVSVYFHQVGYHLSADDAVNGPDTPNKFLRAYSFMRTDRHFDELGISNAVDAPAWNETLFPCGDEWGP